jgi:hypothetical protein
MGYRMRSLAIIFMLQVRCFHAHQYLNQHFRLRCRLLIFYALRVTMNKCWKGQNQQSLCSFKYLAAYSLVSNHGVLSPIYEGSLLHQ